MEWNYSGKPNNPGWYAVLVCYDAHEGIFPMGAWWSGTEWNQKAVIAFGDYRTTEKEAKDLAYEYDPGV